MLPECLQEMLSNSLLHPQRQQDEKRRQAAAVTNQQAAPAIIAPKRPSKAAGLRVPRGKKVILQPLACLQGEEKAEKHAV